MIAYETYQTVPLLDQRDMDPYMQIHDQDKDFPIPGEEYTFVRLDLSRTLIKNPTFTFFIRTSENILAPSGIEKGNIIVVDRSGEPRHNSLILGFVEGEFLLRRLYMKEDILLLLSDDPDCPKIEIEPDMHFSVWGVVRDWLKE